MRKDKRPCGEGAWKTGDIDIHYKNIEESIAQRILSYLMNRPEAKDTLEGIAQWWLEREYIEESVDRVSRELSLLCSQGLVVQEKGVGMSPYYKLNGDPKKIMRNIFESEIK